MHDPINSFITNNIHAVIFILFLIVIYSIRSKVGKWVDQFLTMKNLKATLFVILILMIFLVSNTFYNFIPIDVELVAPYMIAMSALLASIVAMINLRNSYINIVVDKKDKIIALTHNAIIRIGFFYDKSNIYRKIFLGEEPMSKQNLNLYEQLLKDILELLVTKEIHRYIDKNESELLYRLHGNIFLMLTVQKTVIELLDRKPVEIIKHKVFDEKQLKIYNDIINDLEQLSKLFETIRKTGLEEYNKIVKEEN